MNPNTSTTGNMMTCSTAYQPAHTVPGNTEGHAGTGDTPRAWAHDPRVEPWDYWWGHFYRWKRRPRCDGGED